MELRAVVTFGRGNLKLTAMRGDISGPLTSKYSRTLFLIGTRFDPFTVPLDLDLPFIKTHFVLPSTFTRETFLFINRVKALDTDARPNPIPSAISFAEHGLR